MINKSLNEQYREWLDNLCLPDCKDSRLAYNETLIPMYAKRYPFMCRTTRNGNKPRPEDIEAEKKYGLFCRIPIKENRVFWMFMSGDALLQFEKDYRSILR